MRVLLRGGLTVARSCKLAGRFFREFLQLSFCAVREKVFVIFRFAPLAAKCAGLPRINIIIFATACACASTRVFFTNSLNLANYFSLIHLTTSPQLKPQSHHIRLRVFFSQMKKNLANYFSLIHLITSPQLKPQSQHIQVL